MDYERIHKVQMGVISPSKLRMKLLGVHNSRRKEGGSNSSRTSPSKLEEMEHAKNHLLTCDVDEQSSSEHCSMIDLKPVATSVDHKLELAAAELHSEEKTEMTRSRSQNITRAVSNQVQSSGSLSTVHPVRSVEENGNGYDSGHDNGSTSSFEFYKGERSAHHPPAAGPFFRHVPSKWNDAEKWIVNRQAMHPYALKKNVQHSQGSRPMPSNWARNVPVMIADTKRIDSNNPAEQNVVGKFCFVPQCLQSKLVSANKMSEPGDFSRAVGDPRSQGIVEKEEDQKASISERPISAVPAPQTVESVSMRDVGTEMTPIPSQDASRTGTPMGATTPSRSPRLSTPPTPKRGAMAKVHENDFKEKGGKQELSERDLKLKIRGEIAALGIQLGKMNIASWASKEAESAAPSPWNFDAEQNVKAEYEARAAAWEEAEKSKHMARYKREEVKIQAWEDHQKAKMEAKMRKLEVLAERMKAHGHEKISQKVAEARRQAEERRADAEARKNEEAARTAHRVEQIRRTGRIPPSHVRCCSWLL